LRTTIRGEGIGSVALLNNAAVSPPWNPGTAKLIGPLHSPSFRFPDASAAITLPPGSPSRQ
jgi:hypothetical protein